jgi:hypothetical protein
VNNREAQRRRRMIISQIKPLFVSKLTSVAGQAIKDQLLELELLRSGNSTSTITAPGIMESTDGDSTVSDLSIGDQYLALDNHLNWSDNNMTLTPSQATPGQQRGMTGGLLPEHSAKGHGSAVDSMPGKEIARSWMDVSDRQSTATHFDARSVGSHSVNTVLRDTDSSFTRLLCCSSSPESLPQQTRATTTQRSSVPQPALHLAAAGGNVICVQTLLSFHADPDLTDGQGMTPLHVCAASGESSVDHASITTMLINAGADTVARDDEGRTPLQVAAMKGNVMVLSTLLSCGVSM